MIFDRTQADVDEAKEIYENKFKKFLELSESDIATLERGRMTENTLNRIENKQAELKTMLNNIGYWHTDISNKSWVLGDVFHTTDFDRILDNEYELVSAFFTYPSTPRVPNISFSYNDINSIEKILYDIENMIMDVKNNYRECGNFECGSD